MRVAILGAGGCFGINTAQWFLSTGNEVLGVGRFPQKSPPFSLELKHDNYQYRALHVVSELDLLMEAFDEFEPEVIINYAALAEVPLSWKYPERYAETNYLGLVRLAKAIAKRPWLKHFMHISSSEVYGSNDHPVEETAPIRCSSPYAVSKASGDLHLMTLSDFPWTIFRPSNCYCPGQLLHRVIPRAVFCGLTGEKMPLHGGGLVRKSYMHATDLSRALAAMAKTPKQEIYNCGVSMPTAIRDVVGVVAKFFNKSLEEFCDITPGRSQEDSCFWIDSSKLRATGWEPKIRLGGGVMEMVGWGEKYLGYLMKESPTYRMRA